MRGVTSASPHHYSREKMTSRAVTTDGRRTKHRSRGANKNTDANTMHNSNADGCCSARQIGGRPSSSAALSLLRPSLVSASVTGTQRGRCLVRSHYHSDKRLTRSRYDVR